MREKEYREGMALDILLGEHGRMTMRRVFVENGKNLSWKEHMLEERAGYIMHAIPRACERDCKRPPFFLFLWRKDSCRRRAAL